MAKSRRERLQDEISTLEDAILFAESEEIKDLKEAKALLNKVKRYFEQGTWSMAERELSKNEAIKNSDWYREFTEKRDKEKGRAEGQTPKQIRFIGDGLCGKYGHNMVKVKLSNVRWYYQCRLCGKRGKSQSIK